MSSNNNEDQDLALIRFSQNALQTGKHLRYSEMGYISDMIKLLLPFLG